MVVIVLISRGSANRREVIVEESVELVDIPC